MTNPKLELVRGRRRTRGHAGGLRIRPQGLLFPLSRHGLVIFIYFPDVTEEEFRDTLEHARPSFILELRTSPRFDIGRLNRQMAFQAFRKQNAAYLDLTSPLMGKVDREFILSSVRRFLDTTRPSFDRPVVFLTNRMECGNDFRDRVLEIVTSLDSRASEVYEVPRFVSEFARRVSWRRVGGGEITR